MVSMSNDTPRQIDERLAEMYGELATIKRHVASDASMIYSAAGARREYYGRELRYNMSFEEALQKAEKLVADQGFRYHDAEDHLKSYRQGLKDTHAKLDEIEEQDSLYTGWSRFFVVTSSQGHIHSSMHCKSCYDTTTFGWLPHLSGWSEAEAVEACGPALCSVCFPSAPVEHQGGKISPEDAEQLSKGKTITELQAERQAVKDEREAKKAAKAARKVERARKVLAKAEKFYAENGGFDAVMQWEPGRLYSFDLQQTVEDLIRDDMKRVNGQRPYNEDPRQIIAQAEAA